MTIGPPPAPYRRIVVCTVAALIATLAACGQENHYVAPPPPKVTVALPVQQKVTRYLEATGYVAAVNTTNLVARVQGFLQAINYKDGEEVRKARPSSPSSRHRTSSSSSRHKPPRPARRPR